MAERSKALRSGRSPLLRAWVRIPLLTRYLFRHLFPPPTWLVDTSYPLTLQLASQQSGAVEACWAHNPEVGRSKLPSASNFLMPGAGQKVIIAF